MIEATEQVATVQAPDDERPLAAPAFREVSLRDALQQGALGSIVIIFISAVGMVERFSALDVIQPYLTVSYILLALVPFIFGYRAGKPLEDAEGLPPVRTGARNVVAGLVAGVIIGLVTGLFLLLISTYNLRDIFLALSPRLTDLMTFGLEVRPAALLLWPAAAGILGALGSMTVIPPDWWRRPLLSAIIWTLLVGLFQQFFGGILRGLGLDSVRTFLYSPLGGLQVIGAVTVFALVFAAYVLVEHNRAGARARYAALTEEQRQRRSYVGVGLLILALLILPQVADVFVSEVLSLVGIYLLMGLGLNIVVGFAGLLDLGYVAFFAVGAYVTAMLTSPSSPAFAPQLTFWTALPFVVLAAAFAGILVGTPVLRMRGDYLAIVTLGFGEIARILFVSEWLAPYVGGAQGILSVPNISVGSFVTRTPPELIYVIGAFVLLAVYVSWALKNSRIGRAWMAMREDEPVAEVIGIDITQAKLLAFVVGAVLASFAGAIFATKLGSVFPHSFQILVSITVLVLIIVGGMGSIPGVIVGALVLVGVPEMFREFSEYRLLLYGILLIYMMLQRPEGFIPAKERMRELHQEEMLQDAWLRDQEAADRETPARARGRDPDAGLI